MAIFQTLRPEYKLEFNCKVIIMKPLKKAYVRLGSKKIIVFLILFFELFGRQSISNADVSRFNLPEQFGFLSFCQTAQEEAMQQRAEEVIGANDALIQRTIQAHGGNYFHQGKSKILIFNQKIYKDFSLKVISGQRLIIETPDGSFTLNVVNE